MASFLETWSEIFQTWCDDSLYWALRFHISVVDLDKTSGAIWHWKYYSENLFSHLVPPQLSDEDQTMCGCCTEIDKAVSSMGKKGSFECMVKMLEREAWKESERKWSDDLTITCETGLWNCLQYMMSFWHTKDGYSLALLTKSGMCIGISIWICPSVWGFL